MMAKVCGRWTLVDPGRDSELKSSHGGGSRLDRDLRGTPNKLKVQGERSSKHEQMHKGTQHTHDVPRFGALVGR